MKAQMALEIEQRLARCPCASRGGSGGVSSRGIETMDNQE